jgi:hypothetical protein
VRNVRFSKEGAEKFTGQVERFTGGIQGPYWLFPWKSVADGFSWIYAGTTFLGRIEGVTHTNVTRFTTVLGDDNYGAVASTLWSGTLLGDLPVITYNGAVDPPQQFNFLNDRFEDLANWPANTFADIMITVSDHLVALKVTKSADENPRMVKWSQPADPGTYPSSWDETDPATGAGEVTLKATEGEIITAADLNNSTLIYKEDSVIAMRFVGGQAIFRFDTVFAQFGALALNCVGVLENSHVVVTPTDVILHNGSTFDSIIDDKNRDLLFNTLDRTKKDRVTVAVDRQRSEVWITWVSTASAGNLDKALIWNYADNAWSQRDIQQLNFIAEGEIDQATTSRIYNNFTTQIYDGFGEVYDSQTTLPGVLAADQTNTKFFEFNQTNTFDGTLMTVLLERTGLPVVGRTREGEWRTDLDSRKFVRRVHIKMRSSGPVNISVGGQEVPDGPVDWAAAQTFDPDIDRYIDCRVNTRFFAIKFESSTDISWTVYGYTPDLDIIGEAPR